VFLARKPVATAATCALVHTFSVPGRQRRIVR
jgi:hypothetical protein